MANSPFQNPYESQYPNRKRQWEHDANIHSQYPVKNKEIVTIYSLFPNLDRYAVGVQEMLKDLQRLAESKPSSYPPCDILQFGDKYEIRVALAGFTREDLSITVENSTLSIKSNVDTDDTPEGISVIHNGIAKRNFTHTFALGKYVEVESAKMSDGILTINLFTNIPEEKRPKAIDIN